MSYDWRKRRQGLGYYASSVIPASLAQRCDDVGVVDDEPNHGKQPACLYGTRRRERIDRPRPDQRPTATSGSLAEGAGMPSSSWLCVVLVAMVVADARWAQGGQRVSGARSS
jgi:hypothetical protein